MFSLFFRPSPDREEFLIAELWECGTTGIIEEDGGIRAFFDDLSLLHRFTSDAPELREEQPIDWAQATHRGRSAVLSNPTLVPPADATRPSAAPHLSWDGLRDRPSPRHPARARGY